MISRVLLERGRELEFKSLGGRAFTLDAGETREIVMQFKLGREFTSEDVENEKDPHIHVETHAEGILTGGMSYLLDSKLKSPAPQIPSKAGKMQCEQKAKQLLDCLNLPTDEVKSVQVKRITIDIDMEKDC